MGLGLYLRADIPGKRWLKRAPSRDRIFAAIAETAARYADETGDPVARWYWSSQHGERLLLNLCPFEENVEFSIDSARVVCSAKTSGAGPGYHRFVVGLLDRLQEARGLAWEEDEDGGDETDYFRQRDVGALEAAMCQQTRALAKLVLEHAAEGSTGFRLNIPLDFAPLRDEFAVSPLGEWPRSWFEALASADDDQALALAAEFQPWWDGGLTADNLKKFGLACCWMDVPWVQAANEREAADCDLAILCFDRARELDPTIDLPEWEIAELRRVIERTGDDAAPAETGIGFRRTEMVLPLTGGWTVVLPGYFHSEYETDGDCQVYYFGDRVLRGSSFSFNSIPPQKTLEKLSGGEPMRALTLSGDHLVGQYNAKWNAEEETFILSALVAKTDGVCIVTVSYLEEQDEAWALKAASTISCPPSTHH
jgi:hypothetical protein